MIDLSKLTPAPWTHDGRRGVCGPPGSNMQIYDEGGHCEEEAEFIALARNAFDVMMRRNWGTIRWTNGWAIVREPHSNGPEIDYFYVGNENGRGCEPSPIYPDPFAALVEADKWMCEQEAKK